MSERPIGIFDSGVGGTSIWREVQKTVPQENTIYLADSANAPYGEKPNEHIVGLSIKNTEILLEHGCKLIIVACNTATTNAVDILRKNYDVPFIGIEPAIKPAALQSRSKTVGVLATKGTLTSSLFHSTSENHAHGIRILEQEGTGLVPLIEQGKIDTDETKVLLKKYLEPMISEGMDYLVLGCTHYPYLIPVLRKLLPEHVQIIDSGEAVARQTKTVLERMNLLNATSALGSHCFYTNAEVAILRQFLGEIDVPLEVSHLEF